MGDIKKVPQIISFLSGKGGAGKTSASIGISRLLNDIGFSVLLVDFDLTTNGASYFFKNLYDKPSDLLGTLDILQEGKYDLKKAESFNIYVEINENFVFIPSRINFSVKFPLIDSVNYSESILKDYLDSIIQHNRKKYDFIIIDNQAGSNISSKSSAKVSNKVIIVSELDPISSDSVDTLLIQIGEYFPDFRRHLINKLDIREIKDYTNLSTVFQSMNRLPPLPFDFDVRVAFGSRQIPVDSIEPNTFTLALFNTVKSILPEHGEKVDEYEKDLSKKFYEYQQVIDQLMDQKIDLEKKIEEHRKQSEKRRSKFDLMITILIAYLGTGIIAISFKTRVIEMMGIETIPLIVGIIILFMSGLFLVRRRLIFKESIDDIEELDKAKKGLMDIEKEIDMYKSLMLTRSKDFISAFLSK